MVNLRPNEKRAKNAILLIRIILFLEIISLISRVFELNLIQKAIDGATYTLEDVNQNDLIIGIIGTTYLIFFIISSITFTLWFRRAYFNLHIKAANLTYKEKWATLSWFIPIINIIRPYQIMLEIFKVTNDLFIKNGITFNERKITEKSISIWWGLWVLSNVIGRLIYRYSDKFETLDELFILSIIKIADCLIGIASAFLIIKIIKEYSKVEPLLNEIKDKEEVNLTT